jgi:hypothetical protein
MELSPSWEAANCAATEELPSILWNPKVHYRVHEGSPLVPILTQINPVRTTPSYLSKIHFIIVHSPTSWSSKWSVSFWPSHQNSICIPILPHSCYRPSASHPPDLIFLITLGEEYKLWSSSLCIMSLHLSLVQIFSLAPCSQTPSVYVLPLILKTKFHARTEPQAKL